MYPGEIAFAREFQRHFGIDFGLAGETGDEVGRDKGIAPDSPQRGDGGEYVGTTIMPSHACEDGVGS